MAEIHQLRHPLVLECEAEMGRLGMSQNQAAKRMGISSTQLSQWRHGKYPGNVPQLEARVRAWLATEREAEQHSLDDAGLDRHRDLLVTGEVAALLTHAQATADIVLVQGASGAGKSWAARHYCRTHTAAHYAAMTCAVRSLSGMLGRVSEVVGGGYVAHRSALEAETSVIEQLRDRSALLVIDEAHHLTPRLLDELRCIRDVAGCGLALIGDDSIAMRLARCPQILGRIGGAVRKTTPAEPDVEQLVAGFLERRASAREIKAGLAAARGPGGLHALRRMLARAWMLARIEERDAVSTADLEMAALGAASQPEFAEAKEASA